MADQGASEKTEQATPERLKKAREEGNIPVSQEVPTALIVLILLLCATLIAPTLCTGLAGQVQAGLSMHVNNMDNATMCSLLRAAGTNILLLLAPFMAVMAVMSVGSSFVAGGIGFSPKALKWRWEQLSPMTGLKSLVSLKSLVHLLISMAKFAIISIVLWAYLNDNMGLILSLHWTSPEGLLAAIGRLSLGACGRITVALVVIATADLVYQRWVHRSKLKMSHQEVKEERKQYELPGEVRGKIRRMQMSMTKKRMLKAVPTADVVVVNPTHVAVALKYDPASMDAPVVVAKGADFLCQTIKEIAAKHNVPVVERPELARALYSNAEEGQAVPETLYVAVAEVLAMIMRLRRGKRP